MFVKRQRKGFTLVELLVILAVISILFVAYQSKVDFATDKAKTAGVQTDFRSYQLAMETVAREQTGFKVANAAIDAADQTTLIAQLNANLDKKLQIKAGASETELATVAPANDPWGKPYTGKFIKAVLADETTYPGVKTDDIVVVFTSKGPNGDTDTTDDLVIYTFYGANGVTTHTKGFSSDQ